MFRLKGTKTNVTSAKTEPGFIYIHEKPEFNNSITTWSKSILIPEIFFLSPLIPSLLTIQYFNLGKKLKTKHSTYLRCMHVVIIVTTNCYHDLFSHNTISWLETDSSSINNIQPSHSPFKKCYTSLITGLYLCVYLLM